MRLIYRRYILFLLFLSTSGYTQTFHQYETAEVTPRGGFQIGGGIGVIMLSGWETRDFFPVEYLKFLPSALMYAKLGAADNLELGLGLSIGPRMIVAGKYRSFQTKSAISLHSSLSGYIRNNITGLSYTIEPCFIWPSWFAGVNLSGIYYNFDTIIGGWGQTGSCINFGGVIKNGNGEGARINILSYIWGSNGEFRIGRQGRFRLKIGTFWTIPLIGFAQEVAFFPSDFPQIVGLSIGIAYVKPPEEVHYRQRWRRW